MDKTAKKAKKVITYDFMSIDEDKKKRIIKALGVIHGVSEFENINEQQKIAILNDLEKIITKLNSADYSSDKDNMEDMENMDLSSKMHNFKATVNHVMGNTGIATEEFAKNIKKFLEDSYNDKDKQFFKPPPAAGGKYIRKKSSKKKKYTKKLKKHKKKTIKKRKSNKIKSKKRR